MLPPSVPASMLLPVQQQQPHFHPYQYPNNYYMNHQQAEPMWFPMVVLPPLRAKQLGEDEGEGESHLFRNSPCRVDGGISPSSCSTPSHKGSLSFILSAQVEPEVAAKAEVSRVSRPKSKKRAAPSAGEDGASKKKAKKGSKFCSVEGCESRAKHARRCWKHGGSVKCKVTDCANRAKSKGVCWSHGGGTVCAFSDCETISVSNGFCWAHGGGKRCSVANCSKPAYERTHNLCGAHFRANKDKQPQ